MDYCYFAAQPQQAYVDYSELLTLLSQCSSEPLLHTPDLSKVENGDIIESFLFDDSITSSATTSPKSTCDTSCTDPDEFNNITAAGSLSPQQFFPFPNFQIDPEVSAVKSSTQNPIQSQHPLVVGELDAEQDCYSPTTRLRKPKRTATRTTKTVVDPCFDRARDFLCTICGNKFLRKQDMQRHAATHVERQHVCQSNGCGFAFARRDALVRHQKSSRCKGFVASN
ncbi:hypothetical protein BCR33DRAFT_794526 [Rhizoclosmatium globosum]|uniref:C2H2-type domain-containing protein n=1 Tax=Rhizoclosmatium globosum TaxID=329046 RepID=A0A1Y2AUW4_9FUNG|nr:hypothetical protein BCR33DRAFT_794526 [Rhizoclosmatium globosum]|eukprot:ORY26388.1 hypothetical protein BCR33DRAFT_794526 [Rhizoclosmatium globosum]